MKRFLPFLALLTFAKTSLAQTPVPMASQPGLVYTENFADITNWTNNFASGIGAACWDTVSINSTGSIPDGVKTTIKMVFSTGNSGGVQKGAGNIIMLTTGTIDNSSALAMEILLNYTGVNAGTISFDWAQVNNSTGNRAASLRVYASATGTAPWTEITGAAVLNFINNFSPIATGSITNVALPASFNNTSTCRIRFYEYNGMGGTTGSRPKISIDNLTLTAVATAPCSTPAAQPTGLVFGAITASSIAGSFSAAIPAADEYLTVASINPSLTSNPVDGVVYNVGDALGDGFVVARGSSLSFTATGLAPATTYYFFVFAVKSACVGGPMYLTAAPLTGSATTISPNPPCTAPAGQPNTLVFGSPGVNNISGSFTTTAADEYLVLVSTFTLLSANPVNGTVYSAGNVLGNAIVVQRNNLNTFNATGLLPNTKYSFFIFSTNSLNCTGGPSYNTIAPLNDSISTLPLPACATPAQQPTNLVLNPANTSIAGSFAAAPGADDYLTVMSTSPSLASNPVNNTDYTLGTGLGGGTVIANSAANSFTAPGLMVSTTYYFFVFAANKNCSGGTKYLTVSPLTGNATTTNSAANNYYFGTLHSHSAYSDGNKDNLSFNPTDDYNYAITALCMDFLGISEHNHFSSAANPGNHLATYHDGLARATSFTSSHPNFVALYGMEWGVISGGGHVVIYGDGMDNLFGWESGSGGWGPTNNYDIFVPKSVYKGNTGIFKNVNDFAVNNTFVTLAHPNSTDFDNLAGTAYDAQSDSAITGTAVESGPATSTNTTYTNPGTSMSYLNYYNTLLARGYHLGPNIDHDNHYTTFGHTTFSRTAVIAPSLTKTEIIKAMRNMHFYATQDCDTKVDFTINTKIMGTVFANRYSPSISVNLSDATTSTSTAVIKIMSGTPGSGTLPVQIGTATGSNLNFTDNSLANTMTAYYYADITNGTSRIITAPIWYTRNDALVLPITLGDFLVKKNGKSVQLNWSTYQESNSQNFVIERSSDGRNWNTIAHIPAAGNSTSRLDYMAFDNNPLGGNNYYRLKLVDQAGKNEYSPVRSVFFQSPFSITLTPNPARDYIRISIIGLSAQTKTIELVDVNGSVVYRETTGGNFVRINTGGWGKGMYFVKLVTEAGVLTEKVVLE